MGVPLVGKRHQRKASTPQAADRGLTAIRHRISSASGSRRSSPYHQQSFRPKQSSADDRAHSVGALSSRRIAPQGAIHARRIHVLCEQLDSSKVGRHAIGRSQDRRGGTLAASGGSGGWNQGQDQVRYVGPVLSCGSLGVLRSQPHFVGHSSRGLEEGGVQALAFASVPNANKRPCSCHRSK